MSAGGDITKLFNYVIDTYGINAASKLCLYMDDHVSVNVAIARKTRVPIIECGTHKITLILHTLKEDYKDILEKVQRLMSTLNAIKTRHHPCKADAPMVMFNNVKRWSGKLAMLDRYFAIYRKMDRVDDDLTDFIRTSREKAQLKTLYDDLKSVSKKLQSAKVPLLDVRKLFEHTILVLVRTWSLRLAQ
ncbi:hypothetical protein PF010_g4067 [Phytophthora fragariae]|uniref:Uncharacterized protein n=3 Tax=Phytophthora fragariae TaxID=53985 RepID=A0A6A3LW66_9STRA|nr:hypothetical protein PF011_g5370 [Phytophthora fragariae]KAE9129776.1 hypothetical protein PF010_g4067 [Phytophthora fragariae]KAE9243977.1 hypothetical protein PF004_g5869 [Phytophthora fragariae]